MRIFVFAVLLFIFNHALAQPLRIGMPLGDSITRQKLQLQLTQIYTELGFEPEFIALPSERRLRLLKDGEIDADLFRICQLDEAYAELLVVPVVLDTLKLNAYSLTSDKLMDWQQRKDLLISHIRGFKMAEQQEFAGVRVLVNSDAQAFGLMLQGRVDIVLEDSRTAEKFLAAQQDMQSIIWQSVADFTMCHVVNRSLQPHLPAITQQLQN